MNQLREQEEASQRILDEMVVRDRVLKEESEQGMKASEYQVWRFLNSASLYFLFDF